MPDTQHDELPAAQALSTRPRTSTGVVPGWIRPYTDVDATFAPESRHATMSSSAPSGRVSPVAAYTTASGGSSRTDDESAVAITPVGRSRPTRSAASRPTLSAFDTTTAVNSRSGFAITARTAGWPTFPVPHTATLNRWPIGEAS